VLRVEHHGRAALHGKLAGAGEAGVTGADDRHVGAVGQVCERARRRFVGFPPPGLQLEVRMIDIALAHGASASAEERRFIVITVCLMKWRGREQGSRSMVITSKTALSQRLLAA
jgi:hypothetical protein